ncbi:hypothetical protein JYB87_07930 [Shewanella avicenniae]|uniref:Uncharacterized protein n=1 Tax=Shewanella avicenniae TaxID=2814294 RepID=A0ABX7QW41_9GAMM|nr:hypothetical protein [Shewanella avicenniae]QSX35130.1 hypothetical protein JYB87_07930 [Shewanella avicenniae]
MDFCTKREALQFDVEVNGLTSETTELSSVLLRQNLDLHVEFPDLVTLGHPVSMWATCKNAVEVNPVTIEMGVYFQIVSEYESSQKFDVDGGYSRVELIEKLKSGKSLGVQMPTDILLYQFLFGKRSVKAKIKAVNKPRILLDVTLTPVPVY